MAYRTIPSSTDYGLHPVLSSLSGSDVVLSGTKADGTHFSDRRLSNVSLVPRDGRVFVIGMEPGRGIRQFDMGRVVRLETDDVVLLEDDIQTVLSQITQASPGSSEELP